MEYKNIQEAIFLERPNRFIARMKIDGREELCHVKNTGRCKELLIPGAKIFVQEHEKKVGRKTNFSLIGVKKEELLINIDSQAPNQAFGEWVAQGHLLESVTKLQPEVKFEESRFDYYIQTDTRRAFAEVKGVTLEVNGVARFPDAPTERGIKHIHSLCKCMEEGYEAYLCFVIQMKGVHRFEPNWATHSAFGEALQTAERRGVHILAYDCIVTKDSMTMDAPVEVCLGKNVV